MSLGAWVPYAFLPRRSNVLPWRRTLSGEVKRLSTGRTFKISQSSKRRGTKTDAQTRSLAADRSVGGLFLFGGQGGRICGSPFRQDATDRLGRRSRAAVRTPCASNGTAEVRGDAKRFLWRGTAGRQEKKGRASIVGGSASVVTVSTVFPLHPFGRFSIHCYRRPLAAKYVTKEISCPGRESNTKTNGQI